MIKLIGVLLALIVSSLGSSNAQKSTTRVKVVYKWVINGEERDRGGKNTLIAASGSSKSFTDMSGINLIPETPKEVSYIDYLSKKTFQAADLSDGSKVYTETNFAEYTEIIETDEVEKILNYNCKKVKTVLRSNSIEIWYTTEIDAKGTPIMNYGIPDGLVLKVVRNGNNVLIASEIEVINEKKSEKIIPEYLGEKVDAPLYRHLLTGSFITTVEVFNDEQISWGNPIENPDGIQLNKTYKYAGGTIIAKKVKLPEVTPDYLVFAELEQYSNGDAYDRTGTVFIIPETKEKSFFDALENGVGTVPAFQAANGKSYRGTVATPDFAPAVELVRFFTPFGVNHFNEQVQVYGQKWEEKAYYKQDITELLPLLEGEVWIGAFIGNYDKGG
ncbi:MAG: PNGase F N-terminal domain-containing protein, partial [Mariniphaga sp.]|nr:PNGase F N-terminal domain-containing protein [Mariniphaga sp.]